MKSLIRNICFIKYRSAYKPYQDLAKQQGGGVSLNLAQLEHRAQLCLSTVNIARRVAALVPVVQSVVGTPARLLMCQWLEILALRAGTEQGPVLLQREAAIKSHMTCELMSRKSLYFWPRWALA